MAFITVAGEQLIAQKQGESELLVIPNFVLANIDGLGPEPPDRIEALPDAGDIVATRPVTKQAYVNANQVVFSLVMDSSVGDFDFNWVGLVSQENTLIACAHIPTIQKRATSGGIPGNNITRNFLIAYSGIQTTTAIDVPADTWQIDFTARLLGIDERERLSNYDIYGHEAFFGDGFEVTHISGTDYEVGPGIGYVGGIRAALAAPHALVATPWPTAVWLDVSLQGDITGMEAVIDYIVSADAQTDYTDPNGFDHYVTKIADIDASGNVTDRRVLGSIADQIQDAINKLDHKQSVRFTTTANINLTGLGTQAGGDWSAALTEGDRILVKDQTAGNQNGIYVAAAGVWARATDADGNPEVTAGMTVTVTEGATLADTQYELATNDPIVVGTTALTFHSVSSGRLLRTTIYINDGGTLKASVDGGAFEAASSTFTPHDLTQACDVEVLGGGGGGGGSAATSAGQISGGTGGAGGGYTRGWLTSGFDGATVTVGAGGAPGAAGAAGGNGGTSSFGAALSATGGGGGPAGTAGTTGANVGPLGGTGTGGAINIRGETGEGPFGIGSVPIIRSGRGGDSLYGAGGNNAVSFASGGNASGYGAGGGGSACPPSTGSPASGGSGTGGMIIVREYS
jgi:hypothetical protein